MNKRFIFIIMITLVSSPIMGNELVKLFHHRMTQDEHKHAPSLEVAKITLYFSQEPAIKKTEPVVSKNGWHELKFAIPNVKASATDVLSMMQKLNGAVHKDYSVAIGVDQLGLNVIIKYNPNKLIARSKTTISIKQEKVLEIVLYDKTLEQDLQKKTTSVLRYTHVSKPIIIIDCGHGGHDSGTVGFFKTVEKDLTLAIGLKLKKELEKSNYSVLLTRLDDRFLSLDERTSLANSCKKDALLISLHANNAPKESVAGLETYCLGKELYKPLDYQLATSMDIAIDKTESLRFAEGQHLAQSVHTHILKNALTNGYSLPDRHVKKATAQILSGLVFPGILVEMGFLSNLESAKLLSDSKYQDTVIVKGICNGVNAHVNARLTR